MQWILAIVGALVGLALADGGDEELVGLVAGALIGWQGVRLAQLQRRLAALEGRAVAGSRAPQGAAAPPAAVVGPTPAAMPTDASASSGAPRATAPAAPAPAAVRSPSPAATAAQPPPARPPRREPSLDARVGRLLRRWFMEGNIPAKVGALVTFVAIAMGVRLAVGEGWISVPIELRLAGIALAAVAALVWGWRSRAARPVFAITLQGLAIGALLLTVFGAFRLYALLPAGLAFGLVLVLVAAAALLALLQDAVWLALIGLVGGYLAPVLVSTGSGNHVALFSYYALLNAAVLGIAWRRPWRPLNLLAFGFTFVIGTLWGYRYYQPQHFASTEPFLVLFFLFFVAIPVLYALRQAPPKRGLVDGTLVFGTPLLAFPLQAALLRGEPMALAYSALAVALLYALLAAALLRRRIPLLGQSFAALAVGFATLAVPLALSARWTSATWALEGAALVWTGLQQGQRLPQLAGWLLQLLAAAAWCAAVFGHGVQAQPGELPLLNGHLLGVLLMAGAAFFLAFSYDRALPRRWLVWPPFLLGLFWWQVAGLREVEVHWNAIDERHGVMALLALTAALAGLLRGLLQWPRLGWIVLYVALLAVPSALASGDALEQSALRLPAAPYWLALVAALLFGLARVRVPLQRGISIGHVALLWSVAIALGLGLAQEAWRVQGLGEGWQLAALVLPLLALLLATRRLPAVATWPLAAEFPRYRWRWWGPALGLLAIAWGLSQVSAGSAAPLPWVPLLNPLELLQLAGLLLALRLLLGSDAPGESRDLGRVLLPFAALVFASMAALRAVHHYSGVPWSQALLDQPSAQTTLTVVWSVAGVAAWVLGSRRRLFPVWLGGAVLMGLVLAKLVLVDRQYMGNLTGIVSFLAVGLLLVLVGRIAPSPPRRLAA